MNPDFRELPGFGELNERLLRAGVAPRHVRRYLTELDEHLADLTAEEEKAGRSPADAKLAARVRLGKDDALAGALVAQRQFQSWSARAPWATFGLLPLCFLAGAYAVAGLILWTGWRMFLPGEVSPFVRIDGFAAIYFGVGRLLYFAAPALVGWGVAVIALRQKLGGLWPVLGMALVALIGGAVQVHAYRMPGGVRHVGMDLALAPAFHPAGVLMYFSIAMLPWLAWQVLERRSHPA